MGVTLIRKAAFSFASNVWNALVVASRPSVASLGVMNPSHDNDLTRASKVFKKSFPTGEFDAVDCRPNIFDGFGINAASLITPAPSEAATREKALVELEMIAQWLKRHRYFFYSGDRIQLIVAFPEEVKPIKRQIFKCYVPARGLKKLHGVDFDRVGGQFWEMSDWATGMVWTETTSETN